MFYHSLLDRELSSRYIADILRELEAIFNYAEVKPPAFPNFTVEPVREIQRLGLERELQIIPHVSEKYRLCCLILIRTGMRVNEVIAFKVADLEDGTIYINKRLSEGRLKYARKPGRNNVAKEVPYPLTIELWNQLVEYCRPLRADDIVFPFRVRHLSRIWEQACITARVKYIPLSQAARHSTATEIFRKHRTTALKEIRDTLGHTNLSTGIKNYVIQDERG